MSNRSLLNRVKVSALEKGIHDNCVISSVSIEDRKSKSGILNKAIFLKFTQYDGTKRKAETAMDLSWWKPDPTSEYFNSNILEMCLQLHGILVCFMDEETAFSAFDGVFEDNGIKSLTQLETKNLKKSEMEALLTSLKNAFYAAITPHLKDTDKMLRLKLTTNYKGEDVDIPKYGIFTEPMTVEATLKFTDNELKTHSKAGNVEQKSSSTNMSATI